MEETDSAIYIENNIIENNPNSNIGLSGKIGHLGEYVANPIEKITELYEDKITLLNSLLKEEKEKNETLEKRISSLENMLGKKE